MADKMMRVAGRNNESQTAKSVRVDSDGNLITRVERGKDYKVNVDSITDLVGYLTVINEVGVDRFRFSSENSTSSVRVTFSELETFPILRKEESKMDISFYVYRLEKQVTENPYMRIQFFDGNNGGVGSAITRPIIATGWQ